MSSNLLQFARTAQAAAPAAALAGTTLDFGVGSLAQTITKNIWRANPLGLLIGTAMSIFTPRPLNVGESEAWKLYVISDPQGMFTNPAADFGNFKVYDSNLGPLPSWEMDFTPQGGPGLLLELSPTALIVLPSFDFESFERSANFVDDILDISIGRGDLVFDSKLFPEYATDIPRIFDGTPQVAFGGQLAIDLDQALQDIINAPDIFPVPQPFRLDYYYWRINPVTGAREWYFDYAAYNAAMRQYLTALTAWQRAVFEAKSYAQQEVLDLRDRARRINAHRAARSLRPRSARYARRQRARDVKMKWIKGAKGAQFLLNASMLAFRAFDAFDIISILARSARIAPNGTTIDRLVRDVWSDPYRTREQKLLTFINIGLADWDVDHRVFLRLLVQHQLFEAAFALEGRGLGRIRPVTMNPAGSSGFDRQYAAENTLKRRQVFNDLLRSVGIDPLEFWKG